MTTTPAIQERAEPQLPPLLQQHQRTALRWLLEPLEDYTDLRALVLLLLDQREA